MGSFKWAPGPRFLCPFPGYLARVNGILFSSLFRFKTNWSDFVILSKS